MVAEKPDEHVAIEIETGKPEIKENLKKLRSAGFDRIVVVATSPVAVSACQRGIQSESYGGASAVELMTWLDVG